MLTLHLFSQLQIVEKLVDIVVFLHRQIRESFNEAGKQYY
jgi:hypothetical protein